MKQIITALAVEPKVINMTREPSLVAPTPSEQPFGHYLRRELGARKWSVRYLALRSGVNHSTISRLMHGNRTPTLQTVMRIQAAFAKRDRGISFARELELWVDPVQRVRDALAADPALEVRQVEQMMRYYGMIRTSRPAQPGPIAEPAPSVRRILTSRGR